VLCILGIHSSAYSCSAGGMVRAFMQGLAQCTRPSRAHCCAVLLSQSLSVVPITIPLCLFIAYAYSLPFAVPRFAPTATAAASAVPARAGAVVAAHAAVTAADGWAAIEAAAARIAPVAFARAARLAPVVSTRQRRTTVRLPGAPTEPVEQLWRHPMPTARAFGAGVRVRRAALRPWVRPALACGSRFSDRALTHSLRSDGRSPLGLVVRWQAVAAHCA